MKKSKNGKYTRLEFNSYREILEYVENNPNDMPYSQAYHSSEYSAYTWTEAIEFLKTGWTEGNTEIFDISEGLKTKISEDADAYNINYDITGDYIDIGRFVTGEPECFGQVIAEKAPMETLDITVDVGTACRIDVQTIFNRGAAITTLIDELQKQYFVNLKLIIKTRDHGFYNNNTDRKENHIEIVFNIDMKNEYSRDLLSFYTANSSFLRRICWAIFEVYLGASHTGSYGNYGKNRYHPEEDEIYFEGQADALKKYETKEGTLQAVKNILDKFKK